MAFEFSLRERLRIANSVFGGATYTPVGTFTIKAYSDTVGIDGTGGTELTAAGYSAITLANNTTNFPTATALPKSNAAPVHRDLTAAASIKSIGVFDESGNFFGRKVYATALAIAAGQQWRFAIGSISFNPLNP